jgi:thiol-disulfide isomerase/thioredoxin
MFLAALLVAGLAAAACAPASVKDELEALDERVAALEKQIESLQAGTPPSAQLEQEARAALNDISQLVAAGDVMQAKARIQSIGAKYSATQVGRQFQSIGRELAVVGLDGPTDWGIEKWFQGEDRIDLDGKGTMVVVFWETWCPHCRKEVPKLQALYEKYRDRGLDVLGLTRVTRSATDQSVRDIITQNNVAYPIAKENGAAAKYFSVSGIPAAAVLKGGKVIWRGHPARLTDDLLENWLVS